MTSTILDAASIGTKRLHVFHWLPDFVVAVSVVTMLRSSYPGGTVSTDAMATLPLSLIPTCIVPAYLILFLMIFLQSREQISGH